MRLPRSTALLATLLTAAALLALTACGSSGSDDSTDTGAAVAALLGALTSAIVLLDADTLDSYRFWAVGSVAGRGLDVAGQVLPFALG